MVRHDPMPGESYHGPLPPATDELRALEYELRSYVHMLAGEIGERNVFHYPQLVQAAEYIDKTLSEAGYEVARQEYEVNGQICENWRLKCAAQKDRMKLC